MSFENWNFGVIPTIFILIIIPLGIYFSYWLFITGIIGLNRMQKSSRWKFCIGEVIAAEIKFTKFSDEGVADYLFSLKKTYKYAVNEVEYVSNQAYASDSLYVKEHKNLVEFPKADEIFLKSNQFIKIEKEKEIQIGRKITVYYNQKNPRKSCLFNKINNQIYLPIFMGLLFGIGLTILVLKLIGNLIV